MPSASPFEGGLLCSINKTTDTSAGWDCDDYFPMCDDDIQTYTASVVHQSTNQMTPHLGHLMAASHQQQPLPQQPPHGQMISPDASHHHHQLVQHHQLQQQQHNGSDFTAYLLPLGHGENNNNAHQMNNNSTAAHKTTSVFSSVESSPTSSWEEKMPAEWTESDTIDWLFNVAGKLGIPCEYFASFSPIRGSHLLEMSKEDFLAEYPHHGHKFYEAFRALLHQIQPQHHSPPQAPEPNDTLCLQNTPSVHQQTTGDCWSSLVSPASIDQNYNLHPSSVNNNNAMVQQAENNMGYCTTSDRHHHQPYPIDSSYTYLVGHHSHPHQQQHQQQHHHHQHTGNKSLGYDDPLHQHAAFQQQQLHETYDSYSLDMIGDHYENYSNGTEPSDPEEIMTSSDHMITSIVNGATLKRVGRPTGSKPSNRRRKQDRGYGKLWEFIRDLLHDPKYCPSMVRWEDVNDGVFRIVQSEKLANLWGTIKNNPRMTYEKLSRAMRYYYKSKVFLPVLGRRLVYKFGPHAVLWKPDNPNFEQPCLVDGQV